MFFMLFFISIIFLVSLVQATLIVNNKTVVCYGGPGTLPNMDVFNGQGDWNRTYHPAEPQQIHASWLPQGKAFRVQFSTLISIQKIRLYYWPKDDQLDDNYIYESHDWEFVDGGVAKRSQFMHTLMTDRLEPSTIYQYRVETMYNNVKLHSKTFEVHTPQEDMASFKFLATGDLGVANAVSMPLFKELASSHEYDFLAILGDQGYNMDDFNGTKGDQYMNFAQEVYANLPLLATTGNHEQAYNFSHYKNRFDLLPYYESDFDNALQYSINYKSLHFVSFDTEVFFEGSEAEAQSALHWLERDLIKATRWRSSIPWIVVIGHRPLYCSILSNVDCGEYAEKIRFGYDKQKGLETLLTKYNVDLYLCGHKHNYERTFPVRNNTLLTTSYHNAPSFFQVISGNAGNYEGGDMFDDTPGLPSWLGSRFQGYGYTSVQVSPTHLDLHHHEVNSDGTQGRLRDHVRVTKTKSHTNKQRIIHE